MPKIEMDVLYKKQQRDDKKETLDFHVMGDNLPYSNELVTMAGNMALLHVHDSETDPVPVEFKSIQRDSKKTVLKFEAKGDTQEAMIKLYEFAGHNVKITLEESQMSIEEFEEQHEGIEYNVNEGGTVELEGQVSIDDIPEGESDDVNWDDDDLLN